MNIVSNLYQRAYLDHADNAKKHIANNHQFAYILEEIIKMNNQSPQNTCIYKSMDYPIYNIPYDVMCGMFLFDDSIYSTFIKIVYEELKLYEFTNITIDIDITCDENKQNGITYTVYFSIKYKGGEMYEKRKSKYGEKYDEITNKKVKRW